MSYALSSYQGDADGVVEHDFAMSPVESPLSEHTQRLVLAAQDAARELAVLMGGDVAVYVSGHVGDAGNDSIAITVGQYTLPPTLEPVAMTTSAAAEDPSAAPQSSEQPPASIPADAATDAPPAEPVAQETAPATADLPDVPLSSPLGQ